ncbi:hypothetical protein WA158_004561 [Blastocystis sp. Blastoise]
MSTTEESTKRFPKVPEYRANKSLVHWDDSLNMGLIEKFKGTYIQQFGITYDKSVYLLPEEVLYLKSSDIITVEYNGDYLTYQDLRLRIIPRYIDIPSFATYCFFRNNNYRVLRVERPISLPIKRLYMKTFTNSLDNYDSNEDTNSIDIDELSSLFSFDIINPDRPYKRTSPGLPDYKCVISTIHNNFFSSEEIKTMYNTISNSSNNDIKVIVAIVEDESTKPKYTHPEVKILSDFTKIKKPLTERLTLIRQYKDLWSCPSFKYTSKDEVYQAQDVFLAIWALYIELIEQDIVLSSSEENLCYQLLSSLMRRSEFNIENMSSVSHQNHTISVRSKQIQNIHRYRTLLQRSRLQAYFLITNGLVLSRYEIEFVGTVYAVTYIREPQVQIPMITAIKQSLFSWCKIFPKVNRTKGIIYRDFEYKLYSLFKDIHFNTNIHIEDDNILNYFDPKLSLIPNGYNGVYTIPRRHKNAFSSYLTFHRFFPSSSSSSSSSTTSSSYSSNHNTYSPYPPSLTIDAIISPSSSSTNLPLCALESISSSNTPPPRQLSEIEPSIPSPASLFGKNDILRNRTNSEKNVFSNLGKHSQLKISEYEDVDLYCYVANNPSIFDWSTLYSAAGLSEAVENKNWYKVIVTKAELFTSFIRNLHAYIYIITRGEPCWFSISGYSYIKMALIILLLEEKYESITYPPSPLPNPDIPDTLLDHLLKKDPLLKTLYPSTCLQYSPRLSDPFGPRNDIYSCLNINPYIGIILLKAIWGYRNPHKINDFVHIIYYLQNILVFSINGFLTIQKSRDEKLLRGSPNSLNTLSSLPHALSPTCSLSTSALRTSNDNNTISSILNKSDPYIPNVYVDDLDFELQRGFLKFPISSRDSSGTPITPSPLQYTPNPDTPLTPDLKICLTPITPKEDIHINSSIHSILNPIYSKSQIKTSEDIYDELDINKAIDGDIDIETDNNLDTPRDIPGINTEIDIDKDINTLKTIYREAYTNDGYIGGPVYMGSSDYSPSLNPQYSKSSLYDELRGDIVPLGESIYTFQYKLNKNNKSANSFASPSLLSYDPLSTSAKVMSKEMKIQEKERELRKTNIHGNSLQGGIIVDSAMNDFNKLKYYYRETMIVYGQQMKLILKIPHYSLPLNCLSSLYNLNDYLIPRDYVQILSYTLLDKETFINIFSHPNFSVRQNAHILLIFRIAWKFHAFSPLHRLLVDCLRKAKSASSSSIGTPALKAKEFLYQVKQYEITRYITLVNTNTNDPDKDCYNHIEYDLDYFLGQITRIIIQEDPDSMSLSIYEYASHIYNILEGNPNYNQPPESLDVNGIVYQTN